MSPANESNPVLFMQPGAAHLLPVRSSAVRKGATSVRLSRKWLPCRLLRDMKTMCSMGRALGDVRRPKVLMLQSCTEQQASQAHVNVMVMAHSSSSEFYSPGDEDVAGASR